MIKYLVFLLLACSELHADDWFCSTESSERHGSDIHSCGIGHGATEEQARSAALRNAKSEFNEVCNASDDCVGHQVLLSLKRTDCTKQDGQYKCTRLIVYTVLETLRPVVEESIGDATDRRIAELAKQYEQILYH